MSIRLQMLQVARLARKTLGDSSELVRDFYTAHIHPSGGFTNRAGEPDLYYTAFGVAGLLALEAELPADRLGGFLSKFEDLQRLDLVHLCCLVNCHAAIRQTRRIPWEPEMRTQLLARIENFRTPDGGYNIFTGLKTGSAYGAFLAVGAILDLGGTVPAPETIVQSLKLLETSDGAWANDRHIREAGTNATAAAVVTLLTLGFPVNSDIGNWLLAREHHLGGMTASPSTPLPDLLSTATALHALAMLQCDTAAVRERTLDFVDSLWTNEGGFHGHWADEEIDCEYTYYGLLALGHLA